ncbi:Glycosyltransferase, catalytic subunit of cellulose synthase and poly-beta-1,6-N-acetylglucosamine synthase [Pseudarthrobacter equi]|uniref:Glycosyltransferase, catalytic subunit of cellulose synthase and poly-beta-1,6-N-acetylglucosamine synthase n=1 Tax=Pseudarthrobacter equi TaxID=728066 RepID=A0A1H2B345_9MICC|nr:glycosyltransferase [Pseudarthrobacter equi]SDT52603.1 Glycosyltransferase, catalytic subunit of cellulose synthase and poly-beta-1,6-N-acetylglucosamine synthase [Pseudarthrobacter equi]
MSEAVPVLDPPDADAGPLADGPGRQSLALGQTLLQAGLITTGQLDRALLRAATEGGLLGRHIILETGLNRRHVYEVLAEQWDAPLVDLVSHPSDDALLERLRFSEVSEPGWLPWRLQDGVLTVATAVKPSEAIRRAAMRATGATDVVFRTTTDWDINHSIQRAFRNHLLYESAERLAEELPDGSARTALNRWQTLLPAVLLGCLLAGLALNALLTTIVLLTAVNVVFLVSIGFKTVASLRQPFDVLHDRSAAKARARELERRGLPAEEAERIPDADLPVYTILIPVFREANIIDKLLSNLGQLDYPRSKLDVLVLLEEDDTETIEAAKRSRPPEYVRILVVPRGEPQTKPRACNYGLTFARGEYVVIYDAEDRPDPGQLRAAIDAFRQDAFERQYLDPDRRPLICVQAALNYFNADQNVLTRLFTIEYTHWFDSMLPGLDRSGIPLPLGGTSNHFDTRLLRLVGAWDPWNVTEDADLGLRAAVEGYRVGVISSTTWEEACSQVPAWIKQRTRWIKGYMVTAAVNTRNTLRYIQRTGVAGAVGFLGLILGTPLAFLAYPLVLGFTIVTYVGYNFVGLVLPQWLLVGGVVSMLFGNAMMIVVSGVATWRRHGWRIAIFALLNPAYWVLHSVAAWRAAWQMLTSPHKWEKTPHGLDEEYHDDGRWSA